MGGGKASNSSLVGNISNLVEKAGNKISDLVSKDSATLGEEETLSELIGEETDVSSDSNGSVYSDTDSVITEMDADILGDNEVIDLCEDEEIIDKNEVIFSSFGRTNLILSPKSNKTWGCIILFECLGCSFRG